MILIQLFQGVSQSKANEGKSLLADGMSSKRLVLLMMISNQLPFKRKTLRKK